jgi:hypothetical protein
MRLRLIMWFALSVVFAPAAKADTATVSLSPPAGAEADVGPDVQAAQAIKVLEELHQRLEQAGYKDVQIVPQAVVVSAKDAKGNPTLLLVDTETLMALQLQPPQGSSTTGSGSHDQDRENIRPRRR